MKVAGFTKVAGQINNLEIHILHTGQHSHAKLSSDIAKQLGIVIDHYLDIENVSPANFIGEAISAISTYAEETFVPYIIMAVGDVNTALAAGIAANKLGITLAHLESGLRSYQEDMPEELNRILVDRMADIHFVTEPSGLRNLYEEGINDAQIHFVGNTMIDTLVENRAAILESSSPIPELKKSEYILFTAHRPENTDSKDAATKLVELLLWLASKRQVVYPIHPRMIDRLKAFGLYEQLEDVKSIYIVEPLDYFSLQRIQLDAYAVVTDSGGMQEESTFWRVTCITIRKSTERPVTCLSGTNVVTGVDISKVEAALNKIDGDEHLSSMPEKWDGQSTARILELLSQY